LSIEDLLFTLNMRSKAELTGNGLLHRLNESLNESLFAQYRNNDNDCTNYAVSRTARLKEWH